jgi:hypothetical protein
MPGPTRAKTRSLSLTTGVRWGANSKDQVQPATLTIVGVRLRIALNRKDGAHLSLKRNSGSRWAHSAIERLIMDRIGTACGARTRSGAPCDRAPEAGRRRCDRHGGAAGTGAPRGNQNARTHGQYSAKSRDLLALGRLQNRVADLARAQLKVMELLAQGDARRIEVAEERVAHCMQRLVKAAGALDHVLAERGDEDGRCKLVEGALRLAAAVGAGAVVSRSERPCQDRNERGMG